MPAPGFAVVEQATSTLKKVEEYITAGMDTVTDVTLDLVEYDKEGSDNKVKSLKDMMLRYADMERELHQVLEAVDFVKTESRQAEGVSLESVFDQKLQELKEKNSKKELEKHEKFVDLHQKIKELLDPEGADAISQYTATMSKQEDEDIAMTQQEVNTKCPYTAQEMVHPVRNKHCGHNYDRDGIKELMKNRRSRAKCPVGGCPNEKPIEMSDLEDNKELRRYIENKNRQAGKRKKRVQNMPFSP